MLKVRVAIYCRVITAHSDQIERLNNQIHQYKQMVKRHIDWELVDVYADIKSGKNTTDRVEFQRMLLDCYDRKIDLIITKSVSRFGRNTVDILDVINKLRSLLVDVYFEVENINISETSKTFPLSILEAVAQADSESRSQNIRWGIRREFETGNSKFCNRKCYGYINASDGNIVIDEDQSKVAQKIYELYFNGYSILAIIRYLEEECIKPPTGKDHWAKRTIDTMLSNEKYTGNVVVGKTYGLEYPNNKRIINKSEFQKYLAIDCHVLIISQELFDKIQLKKNKT
ncbi:recombinase family protein [Clostridium tagluense]|uniref:recombinase family protein n=1 Tax=Clostridium tagluense TaxID=360422 RepID=UPI001C6E06E3|nr:recombinase family protein [Clostridium tagluense]MBW9155523.1 recombinase family protein [Clostridium tagluense]WLC66148.1 recombinase family protein [Clostridium tagluense]